MMLPTGYEGQRVMTLLLLLAAVALPTIDLPRNCRAEQREIPPNYAQSNIYDECLRGEQAARDRLAKRWSTVPAAVRETCAEIGRLGGSYVEMDVCVEIHTGALSTSAPAPSPHRAK